MKVELKQIIDQLTEALNLTENVKVCALIDDNGDIVGWNIVDVDEDGKLTPQFDTPFRNLKQLLNFHI
jgi:hypothetical protein